VSDGTLSDEKSFLIRVDDQDQPPVMTVHDIDTIEGVDLDERVVIFDADGQRLSFTASQVPSFMTVRPQSQAIGSDSLIVGIHMAPGLSSAGVYSVLLTASDGFIQVTDTLHVIVRDYGNTETSLRLDQGFGGRMQKYSVVDGVYAVYQNSPFDLNFGFVDTLGTGAHWTFTFVNALSEGTYDTSQGPADFYIQGADTILGQGGCFGPATFQIKRLARRADGSILSFWATFQQACGFPGFHGDLRYQVPGMPIVMVAPGWVSARTNQAFAFSVTAYDSASPAATIIASGLPLGATFVDLGAGRGTFAWTPPRLASGYYLVRFTATSTGGRADTTSTLIRVINSDKAPRAFANGPYFGKAGVPIEFSSTGTNDPEGDLLTYRWTFGDGQFANIPSPRHAYAKPGPYSVTLLVSDGLLLGGDVTLARVVWPDSASASRVDAVGAPRAIHLLAGDAHLCLALETVDLPSSISDMDPLTVRMVAKGLGSTDFIPADPTSVVLGDANRNGVPDVTVCFGSETLRLLFGGVRGSVHVMASIQFALQDGRSFQASLPLDVIGPDGTLRPLLAPNPFRVSGTFSFVTTAEGIVRLWLFDSHGRRVRTLLDVAAMPTGYHDVPIDTQDEDGRALPSGVYFYRLETKEGTRTGRLALIR